MDLLAKFESWLLLNRRPLTVRNRVHYAKKLHDWCTENKLQVLQLHTRDLNKWVPSVGSAPATRKNAVDAISVFYDWAIFEELLEENPARDICTSSSNDNNPFQPYVSSPSQDYLKK